MKYLLIIIALAIGTQAGEVEEAARIVAEWNARDSYTETSIINAAWITKTVNPHAAEVRNWDGTRTDIVTPTHAIEVDWCDKWAEAIGHALYYAEARDLKPGIVLLVKDRAKEMKCIYRCKIVCAKVGIKIWLEDVK